MAESTIRVPRVERETIPFRASLRGKMVFFLILPLVAISAAMLFYWSSSSVSQAREAARSSLGEVAHGIAHRVDVRNTDMLQRAQMASLAWQQSLQDGDSSQFLMSILASRADLSGTFLAVGENEIWYQKDSDGMLSSSSNLPPGVDISLVQGGAAVLPPRREGNVWQSDFVAPLRRDGLIVGLVGFNIATSYLHDLVRVASNGGDIDIHVVDGNDYFVASAGTGTDMTARSVMASPWARLFSSVKGQEGGFFENAHPDTRSPYFFVSEHVAAGDWTVIAGQRREAILNPIESEISILFLVTYVALITVTFSAYFIADKTGKQLEDARLMAENIANGDLGADPGERARGASEIAALFRSFERLVQSGREIAGVCAEIARGNFSGSVRERSKGDELARSINEMSRTRRFAERRLREKNRELEHTQSELVESEKMSSLGSLVSGVAHEVNTPLGVGVTIGSHIADEIAILDGKFRDNDLGKKEMEEFLADASESSAILLTNLERAASLIASFKKIAVDQGSEDNRAVRIGAYLAEILVSLRPRLKTTNVKIQLMVPDQEYEVLTNPGAIAQLVTNMVMNAVIHGFDDGKKSGVVEINLSIRDNVARLIVGDNGRGMPKDVLEKIFNPFFTTKRGSGGSGLGMHVCYNLVTHSLGGKITCDSQEGLGTRFTIEFPAEKFEGIITDGETSTSF